MGGTGRPRALAWSWLSRCQTASLTTHPTEAAPETAGAHGVALKARPRLLLDARGLPLSLQIRTCRPETVLSCPRRRLDCWASRAGMAGAGAGVRDGGRRDVLMTIKVEGGRREIAGSWVKYAKPGSGRAHTQSEQRQGNKIPLPLPWRVAPRRASGPRRRRPGFHAGQGHAPQAQA